jgi:hypothetical protein
MEPIGIGIITDKLDSPFYFRGVSLRAAKVSVRDRIELDNVGSIAERNAVSE